MDPRSIVRIIVTLALEWALWDVGVAVGNWETDDVCKEPKTAALVEEYEPKFVVSLLNGNQRG